MNLVLTIINAIKTLVRELLSLALRLNVLEMVTGLLKDLTSTLYPPLVGKLPRVLKLILDNSDPVNLVIMPIINQLLVLFALSVSTVLTLLTNQCSALRDMKL